MYGQRNFRLKAGHTEVMMRQKNVPSAEAKFGDVVFTYSDKQDGTYKNEAPENAGTWYVKAAVAGTENYTGLEAVQEFVIKKAIPTPDEVTGLIIVQGHPLSELELPEQFRWEDETQIAERTRNTSV